MDASILNYTVNDNVGEFLSKDKKLYINGKWVDPSSGKSFGMLKTLRQVKKLLLVLLETVMI